MSDEVIFTVLARMRSPMIEAHPEWLSGCVSDVEECVLCLEVYQKEQAAEITRLREECASEIDILVCENFKLREALESARDAFLIVEKRCMTDDLLIEEFKHYSAGMYRLAYEQLIKITAALKEG